MEKFERVLRFTALGILGGFVGLSIGTCVKMKSAHSKVKLPDQGIYKIAIMDTGFRSVPFDTAGFKLCKTGHYDFTKKESGIGDDNVGHGAFVTMLVNRHAKSKNICFQIYKIYGRGAEIPSLGDAIIKAYKANVRAINISMSINGYLPRLYKIIKYVTKRGVKVYVSAGNSSRDMNKFCMASPACFSGLNSNFVVVGATDIYNRKAFYSNYGINVDVWQLGDLGNGGLGTSFAAPRALGDYIRSLKLDK